MDAAAEIERLLAHAQPVSLLDPSRFTLEGRRLEPARIVEALKGFLTPARRARIDAVLAGRTYTVATVVEGLVNTGNVSAVMRTAEALGFGAFHLITGDVRYKRSERTSQGAEKWLDVWRWSRPDVCAAALKQAGYRLVVTHLEAAEPIERIDFTRKTALVLGNEREGVSAEMLRLADARCVVPMTGFVQSFNISVAAALCLYHAYRDRLARQGYHGDLTPEEQEALRAAFYMRSLKNARQLLRKTLPDN